MRSKRSGLVHKQEDLNLGCFPRGQKPAFYLPLRAQCPSLVIPAGV